MSRGAGERAVRMVLSGRVQGVGFRYFTRSQARALGLAGWVKNLASGEVEVRVSGPDEGLAIFRQRLRQGPPGSRVEGLTESELEQPASWSSFEIAF